MAFKGLLTVVGSLDISQFWPASKGTNSSDGDTIHLKVNPAASFVFSSSPSAKPKSTTAFIGATVNDHGKTKKVITSKSEIKIRLQGIDTPELHFPVIAAWHPSKRGQFANEFRQHYGAGAAKALHDHLADFVEVSGNPVIRASFVTRIDHPANAIDSHGRFVGDILVGAGAGHNINTWLVEQGWALPLFYDSMTGPEIQTLLDAWKIGRSRAARPGRGLKRPLQPFDPNRNVDNATVPDGGKLNIPKIFRRQATFWSAVAGPLTPAEFVRMLNKGQSGKPDTAYPLTYFLKNIDHLNAKKRVRLVDEIGSQGQTKFEPQALVFREDPSTLLDASGKTVTTW